FGILQIDAHMDLREAYEGFRYSHASIMFNALQIPSLTSLVQVGIRDYCPAEKELAQEDDRIRSWFDHDLQAANFRGQHWNNLCVDIIKDLPDKVYVSFDIDGLEPFNCPGTGTPVPGGLAYAQAIHLLETLYHSGREIIGFDLCEVAPSKGDREWNANVGARILYKLCNLCLASPQK
ncbi:MAG: arginase family protein, partial [Bacteroidota bacterium]